MSSLPNAIIETIKRKKNKCKYDNVITELKLTHRPHISNDSITYVDEGFHGYHMYKNKWCDDRNQYFLTLTLYVPDEEQEYTIEI